MSRSVPKLRGVSAALEGNVVAVSAYDSLLLSRVFGALRPSLDGFLYSSGFTRLTASEFSLSWRRLMTRAPDSSSN